MKDDKDRQPPEPKELNDRRQQSQAEVSESVKQRIDEELRSLASVASHDLQEPLRKIMTFSRLLSEEYAPDLDQRGRDFIRRMEKAAVRMQQLIQGLIEYGGIFSEPRPFARVDLGDCAREAVNRLKSAIEKSGAIIEVEPLPAITADQDQMVVLFTNLLDNSIKFRSAESPRVRVRSEQEIPDEDKCVILFEDNGVGFAADQSEDIFKPLHRLHGRSLYDGSGIGLAICRKIAERHGGLLTAWGEQGKGAVFRIELPINQ